MYRQLDHHRLQQTLDRLVARIGRRFPNSGLMAVARELQAVGNEVSTLAVWLGRPNYPLRVTVWSLGIAIAAIPIAIVPLLDASAAFDTLGDLLSAIEAGINDLVFVALAVYFLLTLEGRFKRRRALSVMRELRSIAHIVDMHQLTKDPEQVFTPPDEHSEQRPPMTRFELSRYLDYASEMLSITGKFAALCVQHFDDPIVLAAVNEVEGLTTGLSRKIWQKIMVLDTAGTEARRANS